jgi:hypothetical protein
VVALLKGVRDLAAREFVGYDGLFPPLGDTTDAPHKTDGIAAAPKDAMGRAAMTSRQ